MKELLPIHNYTCKSVDMSSRKSGQKECLYGSYLETDLDDPDQPTDFSQMYKEHMDNTEDFEAPRSLSEDVFYDDTLRVYCTEGTPLNFSTASSLTDLREIHLGNLDSESVKPEEKCKSKVSATKPQPPKAATTLGKSVTFGEEVNYCTETPLVFSRSSSLGSLSSLEQQSIQDDRSSVVSDFSHRTSEVVSPSDLPDSPSQTMPPSPHRTKYSPSVFQYPQDDTSDVASKDSVKVFAVENTPGVFSAATSLSSLTIEDRPPVEGASLSNLSKASLSEDTETQDRSPLNCFEKKEEDFNRTNHNSVTIQLVETRSRHDTVEGTQSDKTDKESQVAVNSDGVLTVCIYNETPSKYSSKHVQQIQINGTDLSHNGKECENDAQVMSNLLEKRKHFLGRPNFEDHYGYMDNDEVKIYNMEGSLSGLSHVSSLSSLSIISGAGSHVLSCTSENQSDCSSVDNECHYDGQHCNQNGNSVIRNEVSASFSYYSVRLSSDTLVPPMSTESTPSVRNRTSSNLEIKGEEMFVVQNVYSKESDRSSHFSCSCKGSPSSLRRSKEHVCSPTQKNQFNLPKRMVLDSRQPNPYFSPLDTPRTYAVEGTPLHISDNNSLSSITYDDLLQSEGYQKCEDDILGSTPKDISERDVLAAERDDNRPHQGMSLHFMPSPSALVKSPYKTEAALSTLSHSSSSNAESAEELSSGEEALLEECINAGKPKFKSKSNMYHSKSTEAGMEGFVDSPVNDNWFCSRYMGSPTKPFENAVPRSLSRAADLVRRENDNPVRSGSAPCSPTHGLSASCQTEDRISLTPSEKCPSSVGSMDQLSSGEEALLEDCINAGKPKSGKEVKGDTDTWRDVDARNLEVKSEHEVFDESVKNNDNSNDSTTNLLQLQCLDKTFSSKTSHQMSAATLNSSADYSLVSNGSCELEKTRKKAVERVSSVDSSDELSPGEEALLEECINAGKPKYKTRSSKSSSKHFRMGRRKSNRYENPATFALETGEPDPLWSKTAEDRSFNLSATCQQLVECHITDQHGRERIDQVQSVNVLANTSSRESNNMLGPASNLTGLLTPSSSPLEKEVRLFAESSSAECQEDQLGLDSACELSSGEEALLEECINAGRPKSKSKNRRVEAFSPETAHQMSEATLNTSADYSLLSNGSCELEKTQKKAVESVSSVDSSDELSPGEEALLEECINAGKPKYKMRSSKSSSKHYRMGRRKSNRYENPATFVPRTAEPDPLWSKTPEDGSFNLQATCQHLAECHITDQHGHKMMDQVQSELSSRRSCAVNVLSDTGSRESNNMLRPGPNLTGLLTPSSSPLEKEARLFVEPSSAERQDDQLGLDSACELSSGEEALLEECINAGRPKSKSKNRRVEVAEKSPKNVSETSPRKLSTSKAPSILLPKERIGSISTAPFGGLTLNLKEKRKICHLGAPTLPLPQRIVLTAGADELSPGEEALLEDCINAGMPKPKPKEYVSDLTNSNHPNRRSLRKCGIPVYCGGVKGEDGDSNNCTGNLKDNDLGSGGIKSGDFKKVTESEKSAGLKTSSVSKQTLNIRKNSTRSSVAPKADRSRNASGDSVKLFESQKLVRMKHSPKTEQCQNLNRPCEKPGKGFLSKLTTKRFFAPKTQTDQSSKQTVASHKSSVTMKSKSSQESKQQIHTKGKQFSSNTTSNSKCVNKISGMEQISLEDSSNSAKSKTTSKSSRSSENGLLNGRKNSGKCTNN